METIFDFNNTYAGGFTINNEMLPCSLSFPDNKIVFTVIKSGDIPLLKNASFSGYISTERGIMNFRALDAFQTAYNMNWSSYSKEQFLVNSLIVSKERNNIHQEAFRQLNILYDNLDLTGNFATVDQKSLESPNFEVKRTFEEIVFIKTSNQEVELVNTVRWKHQRSSQNIFAVTSEPFFSLVTEDALSIKDLGPVVNRLATFMQLIFGLRQSTTDLILYDLPSESRTDGKGAALYYFFNEELILNHQNKHIRRSFHPVYEVEQLITEIPIYYHKWAQFSNEQQRICWLYFNEINSKEYVRDDRFKNFCAIIQGLETFKSVTKIANVRGEMNGKFRNTMDNVLENLFTAVIDIAFLHKLFELLGVQRDHYQHLNKPLKYDFNERTEDMIMVNAIMTAIIRYHLLKAVSCENGKIKSIIQRDISLFAPRLRFLQMEFTRDGRIQ